MRAGDACPECPQHGLNYPIPTVAEVTRSGEPFVRCPNCEREWGATREVALTDAQESALGCSGVGVLLDHEDATPGEDAIERCWKGSALVFAPADRDDLVSGLIELANAEDAMAEDPSRTAEQRSGDRGARRALTNLIERI